MKHLISKKKLIKLGLKESQMEKVWNLGTRKEQERKAKQIAGAIKGAKKTKWLRSEKARKTYETQANKIYQEWKSGKYDKLSDSEIEKISMKLYKLNEKIDTWRILNSKTLQAREDLRNAKQERLDKIKKRINANQRGYYINISKQASYAKNETTNILLADYIREHRGDDLQKLMEGEQDKDGNWINEPLTENEAIQKLFREEVLIEGLRPLQQGEGYGYINEDTYEIISPI